MTGRRVIALRQVGQEEGDALQDTDQHDRLAGIVAEIWRPGRHPSWISGGAEQHLLDLLRAQRGDIDRAVAEARQEFVVVLAVDQGDVDVRVELAEPRTLRFLRVTRLCFIVVSST